MTGSSFSRRGLLADGTTAALVAADGTIDWWCPDRLDGPPTFYRLLDPDGGALRVGPTGRPGARPSIGTQGPVDGTTVVRTTTEAGEGLLEVVDALVRPGRLLRVATVLRGGVDVEVALVPATRWRPARKVDPFDGGCAFDGLVVRCPGVEFEGAAVVPGSERPGARGSRVLEAGERLVVTVDRRDDDGFPPLTVDAALDRIDRSLEAWRSIAARVRADGSYAGTVRRSLVVLRALQPSTGGLVGAPTTSLPRVVGGERAEDHRHAWVADAARLVALGPDLGLDEEADRALGWLRSVIERDPPLRAAYDLEGLDPNEEDEVAGVPGWRRSQPVRVGRPDGLALDQWLDVAGVASRLAAIGAWPALKRSTDWLADHWAEPSIGRWELRARPHRLASATFACWTALDRLWHLARDRNPLDLDAIVWRQHADEVLAAIEATHVHAAGWIPMAPGIDVPDAALLRLAWSGPWPVDHPRVVGTVDRILGDLGDGPFVHRHGPEVDDGRASADGADLVASFWAVRALARLERWEEAHDRMDQLVHWLGPHGLVPEAADPISRAHRGDRPLAAAHLALIEAAAALDLGPG